MTEILIQHTSLDAFNTKAGHIHDAKAVFKHANSVGAVVATGTEAGDGKRNHDLHDALILEAHARNWFLFASGPGEWVALDQRVFDGCHGNYVGPFIPGKSNHGPRGIAQAHGYVKGIGRVTVGCSHFLAPHNLTEDKRANDPLVEGIGHWGKAAGRGNDICFFCADANERDDKVDVFQGGPFTTVADELGKHPATHGKNAIDIVASYNHDKRVKAKSYDVLDDSEFRLATDHYLLLAGYTVE